MVCDKDVALTCPTCGTRRPGHDYTEVVMEWTNGAKMRIAICLDCAGLNKHTLQDVKEKITRAHHDHWRAEGGVFSTEIVLV